MLIMIIMSFQLSVGSPCRELASQIARVLIKASWNVHGTTIKQWIINRTCTSLSRHTPCIITPYMCNEYFLDQTVKKPTRISGATRNILDLVLTSHTNFVENCDVIDGLSDHLMVSFTVNFKPRMSKKQPRKIYLYSKGDMTSLRSDIADFQASFFNSNPDQQSVQDNWDAFKFELNHLVDKHILSKMSRANQSKPWITGEVRRLSKKKQRLYNRAKSTQKASDWENHRSFQKEVQKKCRRNYWSFQNNMFNESTDLSNKSFWKFVNAKKQEPTTIFSLKSGGKIIFDSKGKATAFNDQFSSVFTSENVSTMPDLGQSAFPAMDHINVTCDGVLKLLQSLDIKKATGPDTLPARLLKEFADEISPILTYIFQKSLDSGIIPSDWREANISPIFKKGDRSVPSNYRPVSITSICCKLIEHIIFSNIMDHYNQHHILTEAQHGFRPGRSCETQLIITAQDLTKSIDDREQVDAIVLDFSKAFDRVPHQRLLRKLDHYGIRGHLLLWAENFLTHRSQRVVIDGQSSEWVPVTSGVPQGTVLGPLLFLTFINDLPAGITSKLRLFADDCLMYRSINNTSDSIKLQEDLDRLHKWSLDWQMLFNTDKCHLMRFTRRRNIIDSQYHLGDDQLTSVSEYPYLGLTFSTDMSWQKQIDKMTTKANRMLGLLRRNLRNCSQKIREQAYIGLVRPHLEYCSPVWSPHTKKDITRVESIQRRAARFVLQNYHRRESVSAMMQQLQWKSLEWRRQAASLVMLYKIQHNIVAINPALYLSPMMPTTTRSFHPSKLQTITSRTQLYQFSFFPRTVQLWNTLPGSVLTAPTVELIAKYIDSRWFVDSTQKRPKRVEQCFRIL